MKYLGVSLAVGLTLSIVGVIGIFSFLPVDEAPQPVEVEAVTVEPVIAPVFGEGDLDAAQLESQLIRREAIYQTQIGHLDQALQERHIAYQSQMQQLTSQISSVQTQLDELQGQAQMLQAQTAELEAMRAERLTLYQTQLAEARRQYDVRFTEIQTQLDQVRESLAQANAQLGQ